MTIQVTVIYILFLKQPTLIYNIKVLFDEENEYLKLVQKPMTANDNIQKIW